MHILFLTYREIETKREREIEADKTEQRERESERERERAKEKERKKTSNKNQTNKQNKEIYTGKKGRNNETTHKTNYTYIDKLHNTQVMKQIIKCKC